MKKIIAISLVLALCLSLCACSFGGSKNQTQDDDPTVETSGPAITDPEHDPDTKEQDVVIMPGTEDTEDDTDDTNDGDDEITAVVDESAKYNNVQAGLSTTVKAGTLTTDDITTVKNMVLSDISTKEKTSSVQILDVSATDNINVIVTALYAQKSSINVTSAQSTGTGSLGVNAGANSAESSGTSATVDSTIYTLVKYDIRNHGEDGSRDWRITNTYVTGTFDTQYYDVSISNNTLVATPKTVVSDQNYTNQVIEDIKNGNGK